MREPSFERASEAERSVANESEGWRKYLHVAGGLSVAERSWKPRAERVSQGHGITKQARSSAGFSCQFEGRAVGWDVHNGASDLA